MNTQRPEWNDANNALAGYGISMVTLYYIRRYLLFLKEFLNGSEFNGYRISEEVQFLFEGIYSVLKDLKREKDGRLEARERKEIADKLGTAASEYRKKIYQGFSDVQKEISKERIIEFTGLCLLIIDDTIKSNKREDGLYNSYNLLHITGGEMKITYLYEMLEGQAAVLSSGFLTSGEAIKLLTVLKQSRLYRKDQNSYILYPDIDLPLFVNKNKLDPRLLEQSELLKLMQKNDCDDIIYQDINEDYHFQNNIINTQILADKLYKLANDPEYSSYVRKESVLISEIYETTFSHKEFTGRANTFYKYEGLGSIYWHMVSKLLLAVQEVYFKVEFNPDEKENLQKIKEIYYDIKSGIAPESSPKKYGAFPTDPYSHTPSFSGAQQPGMTGKVKEDIITRIHEIGIMIKSGKIIINPSLLKTAEFIEQAEKFRFYDVFGTERTIKCSKKSIAFTFCQVPFIYQLSTKNKIIVHSQNERYMNIGGLDLGLNLSQSIFGREGKITHVEVFFDENNL